MKRDFAAHLDALYSCRACPNVAGTPVTGAVPGARIMLVGQAPGPHELEHRRPFAYTAGRRLFSWFSEHLGISEAEFRARVHIAAVIRCFPGRDPKNGGDRVPDADEIARCAAHLDRELPLLRPRSSSPSARWPRNSGSGSPSSSRSSAACTASRAPATPST